MKSLTSLSVALLLCSTLWSSEPTIPKNIQYDGLQYKFLVSDGRGPNTICFYTPVVGTDDPWTSEVAIGRFAGYPNVLSYALGFAKMRSTASLREPKVDTSDDKSKSPTQAFVEKYFEEKDGIEYTVTLVQKDPESDRVVTYGLIAKSKLGTDKVLAWGEEQYPKICEALKLLAKEYSHFKKDQIDTQDVSSAKLKGEYAEIDVSASLQAINTFKTGSEKQKERLRAKIEKQPEQFAPAVFFHLATYLFEQQDEDEAMFWLFAGQLRTTVDIDRCTDRSVVDAVRVLNQQVPPLLVLCQLQDSENSKEILEQVIEWDRSTGYDYDCRWIALHGIKVFHPLSIDHSEFSLAIPRERWEEVTEECRTKFQDEFVEMVDGISEEEMAQLDEKIEALREAR